MTFNLNTDASRKAASLAERIERLQELADRNPAKRGELLRQADALAMELHGIGKGAKGSK